MTHGASLHLLQQRLQLILHRLHLSLQPSLGSFQGVSPLAELLCLLLRLCKLLLGGLPCFCCPGGFPLCLLHMHIKRGIEASCHGL